MNDRHVVGDGLLKYPIAPETHLMGKWSRYVAIVLLATFMGLTMIQPVSSLADDQMSGTDSSDDTGIKVASWALTVPYCIGKSAFAVAGSVVGGLGYAFSGGNSKKPHRPFGPPASMGPISFDQPISEAKNRSTSSASLVTVSKASLLSVPHLHQHPTKRTSEM
jgi:hypothetical protein